MVRRGRHHLDDGLLRSFFAGEFRTTNANSSARYRPALARQAELKKPTHIAVEIELPRRRVDNFNRTREILDRWAGRSIAEESASPAAPPFEPTKKWSELTDIDMTFAEWDARGPDDYLPEDEVEPNRPTKPWDELDDVERLLAEMDGYEPIGDGWHHVSEAPQEPLGRELPGMDLPAL